MQRAKLMAAGIDEGLRLQVVWLSSLKLLRRAIFLAGTEVSSLTRSQIEALLGVRHCKPGRTRFRWRTPSVYNVDICKYNILIAITVIFQK